MATCSVLRLAYRCRAKAHKNAGAELGVQIHCSVFLAEAVFRGIKWVVMWKLCVVDDESNRTVVKLVRGDYSVGRAEDSTIRLTERNISRAHARLFREGEDDWTIEDKNSYTGSFVNGERVSGKRPLKHGDTIQLGDYRLELMDETQQAVEAKALDQAVSAAQLPDRLVIVQGPNLGTVFPLLEQKLLVGRGEECQIALDDASVSRVHVEVLRTEHGLMILDQGSSNGLRINGADLPSAMLRSGDVVELGDVRLKFVPAGVEDVVTQALPVPARETEIDSDFVPKSRSRGSVVLYAGGAVLAIVLIVLALRPSNETPTVTSVRVEAAEVAEASEPVAPADDVAGHDVAGHDVAGQNAEGPAKVLEEARGLAAQGNVVMAHRRLAEIPQDSALRQTEPFRAIEQSWADEIFKAAGESPDPDERRSLLDKVARTPEVDAERRLKAASELAKLDDNLEAVDVSDLPSADARRKGMKPGSVALNNKGKIIAPSGTGVPPRRAIVGKTQKVGVRATVVPPVEPERDDNRAAAEAPPPPPPPPKPAPKPAQEPKSDSELVRESPF
jgi:pSer/pThr/pTyr-binding forkhead associated (FHA) protein